MTSAAWLDRVLRAERRGELLEAVDLAERGLRERPDDVALRHRSVLALARAGATEEAARRFELAGLHHELSEDALALGARIEKDRALQRRGAARRVAAGAAARRYAGVADITGGWYPAVNAATMWLLADDPGRARDTASRALRLVEASGEDRYFAWATRAEAHLLLGDVGAARSALEHAVSRDDGDWGALASTRRQLRLVIDRLGVDPSLLDPLVGPRVAHFCGHLIAPRGGTAPFAATDEPVARRAIEAVVAAERIGVAFGALANGADVLWAEALLDAGADLHVVLPVGEEEFVRASVAPAGPAWERRSARCLERATSVDHGTRDALGGDDVLFRYGAELAMGRAIVAARHLDAEAVQLALWDGAPPRGRAGTAVDVGTWRGRGRRTVVVRPDGRVDAVGNGCRGVTAPPSRDGGAVAAGRSAGASRRVVRAMLFGDVHGFSRLRDDDVPRFAEHVLGALAAVADRHGDAVEHRNSWGDAIYLVVRGAALAAVCALELQEALAAVDPSAAGLPHRPSLRLACHVAPVFRVDDRVIGRPGFMGSHVSRTARLEPVTPPGEVYVTDAFAAALALDDAAGLRCDYVGHLPTAKQGGEVRMHRLARDVLAEPVM